MHGNQTQDENSKKAKQVFDFYRGKVTGPFVVKIILISNVYCRYVYLDRCPVSWLVTAVSHVTPSVPIPVTLWDVRTNTLWFPEAVQAVNYEGLSQISDNKMSGVISWYSIAQSFALTLLQAVVHSVFIVRIFQMCMSLSSKTSWK